jgi:chromosomal replication initiator protein
MMDNSETIQSITAHYYGFTVDMLKSKSRKRELVIARQIAQWFINHFTNLSLKSNGAMFGGRDHSTVIHSLAAVQDLLDTDPHYSNKFYDLQEILMANDLVSAKMKVSKDDIDKELSHLIPEKA